MRSWTQRKGGRTFSRGFCRSFRETINKRANIVSTVSPLNETVEVIDDIISIVPEAYKNNIIESAAALINDRINRHVLMEM